MRQLRPGKSKDNRDKVEHERVFVCQVKVVAQMVVQLVVNRLLVLDKGGCPVNFYVAQRCVLFCIRDIWWPQLALLCTSAVVFYHFFQVARIEYPAQVLLLLQADSDFRVWLPTGLATDWPELLLAQFLIAALIAQLLFGAFFICILVLDFV